MVYCVMFFESGFSLVELLMGRKICIRIFILLSNLYFCWLYFEQFRENDVFLKDRQKRDFDRCYFIKIFLEFYFGECVWLLDKKVEGIVVDKVGFLCFYIVEIFKG